MTLIKPFSCRIKRVGVVAKGNIKDCASDLKKIIAIIKKHHKDVYLDENGAAEMKGQQGHTVPDLLEKCELIFVLGGDGTLIRVANHLPKKKVLVLGINLGSLGFLSEIVLKDLDAAMDKICSRKFMLDRRSMLKVLHFRNGKQINSFYAINDAVINQGSFARLIELKIDVNQRKVISFKADGLIMATPTGSTAHSLSAGGPVVHPELNALIFTPMCPSNLALRPLVVKDDKQITVKVSTRRQDKNYIGLTIDGQQTVPLKYDDEIKIKKADRHLYLIRLSGNRFFRDLRKKLGWGN
ncbi:NAD(+)/NADH kinase [Pseudomonadota bacterium]